MSGGGAHGEVCSCFGTRFSQPVGELPMCTCKSTWKFHEGLCAETPMTMNGCPTLEQIHQCMPNLTVTAGGQSWCDTNEVRSLRHCLTSISTISHTFCSSTCHPHRVAPCHMLIGCRLLANRMLCPFHLQRHQGALPRTRGHSAHHRHHGEPKLGPLRPVLSEGRAPGVQVRGELDGISTRVSRRQRRRNDLQGLSDHCPD